MQFKTTMRYYNTYTSLKLADINKMTVGNPGKDTEKQDGSYTADRNAK